MKFKFSKHWEEQRQKRFSNIPKRGLLLDAERFKARWFEWKLPWTKIIVWEIARYVVGDDNQIITIMYC